MSVYVRGMEMPKRGHTVTLTIMGGGEAVVQYYDCKPQLTVTILYKAVPVPPHGDLIDRDELRDNNNELFEINGEDGTILAMDVSMIDNAPTIIPADKEEQT